MKEHAQNSLEALSDKNFEARKTSPIWPQIKKKLESETEVEIESLLGVEKKRAKKNTIRGFEDVLDGEEFGTGALYNCEGNMYVLENLLALHSERNDAIARIIEQAGNNVEAVRAMRQAEVLNNLKIIDIGSGGSRGYLARACEALGADMWTTDYNGVSNDRHVAGVDLTSQQTPQILLEKTGGDFDFVVENIVGTTWSDPDNLDEVETEHIKNIAAALLKPGGILISAEVDLYTPLVKR